MKYIFLGIAALLFSSGLTAQNASGFGFKAGLNYNTNGNYYKSAISAAENPDGNIGYHFGVFGKFGGLIFAKPE